VLPAGSTVREDAPGRYHLAGSVDPRLLATLTAWCAEQNVLVESLAVEKRTLEDVFLELTGTQVRT
jgi:ABC-2 type transport system ATP-binding protein